MLVHTEMETGSEESMVDAGKEVITEVLDREPYYELYNKYTAEMTACKIKNNFLQRKMAEYFRKRKVVLTVFSLHMSVFLSVY